MPRVKRGVTHVKRRKNILKKTKGYNWGRKKLIKLAKTAVNKAGQHALADRRKKKRVMRRLWQVKLNAAVRILGLNYSTFIHLLKEKKSDLDRKVLAQIAEHENKIFTTIVEKLKK
ncbi:50S ribosomal protein L20 [Patescibacteria group bacterium]|jgi:large subunit ribosomal protein L20|nr:50S ribosomal protein L20 [Patescibacteria group bacterium]